MEPISVPQPLEDPGGQPDRSSPVFNSAVPNVTNLPESVSRNTDVQVCLLTLVSSHFPFCLSYSVWFVIHNLCPFITSVGLSIMTRKFVDSWFFFFFFLFIWNASNQSTASFFVPNMLCHHTILSSPFASLSLLSLLPQSPFCFLFCFFLCRTIPIPMAKRV